MNKKVNALTITGKRWFDSHWGNTYHSVKIWVNDEDPIYIPFSYGYEDHYKQTAFETLQKLGYFEGFSYHDFLMFVSENENAFFNVYDVKYKKNL